MDEERCGYLEQDLSGSMNWTQLCERIKSFRMRNLNCEAIAPTATTSNLIGVAT